MALSDEMQITFVAPSLSRDQTSYQFLTPVIGNFTN